MSFYDDVLEDHNDRHGFNAEEPMGGGLNGTSEGKLREREVHFKAKSEDNSVEHWFRIDNGLTKNVTQVNWENILNSGCDYSMHFDRKKIEE